jgi:hypothetical protein
MEVETRFGKFIVLEKENGVVLAQHVNGGKIIFLDCFISDVYSVIKSIECRYYYDNNKKIKSSTEEEKKLTPLQEIRKYIREEKRKYDYL